MSHRVRPLEEVPHRLMREGLPLRMQRAVRGAIIAARGKGSNRKVMGRA